MSELDSVPKTSGIFLDLLLFRRVNFVCTVPALFTFFAPRSRKLSVVQTVEKLPNYPPFPPFLHLIFGKISDFLSTPSLFFFCPQQPSTFPLFFRKPISGYRKPPSFHRTIFPSHLQWLQDGEINRWIKGERVFFRLGPRQSESRRLGCGGEAICSSDAEFTIALKYYSCPPLVCAHNLNEGHTLTNLW